ncbi:MAG: hypothetical protein RH917_20220 [Lacipirellulaceae bacterium]
MDVHRSKERAFRRAARSSARQTAFAITASGRRPQPPGSVVIDHQSFVQAEEFRVSQPAAVACRTAVEVWAILDD